MVEENSSPAGISGMQHLPQFMEAGDVTQGFLCDRQSTKCHHPCLSYFKVNEDALPPRPCMLGVRGWMGWGMPFPPCLSEVCTPWHLLFPKSHELRNDSFSDLCNIKKCPKTAEFLGVFVQ